VTPYAPQMEFVRQAQQIVAQHVPEARVALLTGSAARGAATETSDLDVYVVVDEPPAPYRKTFLFEGRLVELFVNTRDSLRTFVDNEVHKGQPTTLHMLANSVVLLGEEDAGKLQRWAEETLAKGPPPLAVDELSSRRYLISSLMDDLRDAVERTEASFIASEMVTELADLFLVGHGHWTGRGKWLARRLRAADGDVCDRLIAELRSAVLGDPEELVIVARLILEPFGGYLQDGFRVGGAPGPRQSRDKW